MSSGTPRRIATLAVAAFIACLAAASAFAQTPAPPTPNKGDVAWMLTASVLVLLMTVPGLALFYGGLVRTKNMLSMLMQVFFVVCMVCIIWVIYGYSLAFSEGGSLNAYVGGLSKAFLAGDHAGVHGGDLQRWRGDPRVRLHLLSDDVCLHHAGPDRRRHGRAHEVLRPRSVYSAVGHLRLLPDCAHGLVLGWTGSHGRRRQNAGGGQRRRQDRSAGRHGRGDRQRRSRLRLGCVGFCRRHGGAYQFGNRRPGRRLAGRPSRRLRQGGDASPLADHDADRRGPAVGRLVRFQCRFGSRGQRHGGAGDDQHLRRHGGRRARLDAGRENGQGQTQPAGRGLGRRRRPRRGHAGGRFRRSDGRNRARHRCRFCVHVLLLGDQECAWATTMPSTCSACIASAALSALSAPASWRPPCSAAPACSTMRPAKLPTTTWPPSSSPRPRPSA